MNPVWLTDIAALTSLGDLESTWERLAAGESGIGQVSHFATNGYVSDSAATIAGLETTEKRSRLDSLLEKLLADLPQLPEGTRLLLATTKGRIDLLERGALAGTSSKGAEMGSLVDDLQRRLGVVGGVNINAACASSTIALARGAGMIAHGAADAVLVVGVDIVSEFVFSGFSALKGMSPNPCRPFDADRNGLTLGEGGGAVLLMTQEAAERSGRRPRAVLAGWGVASDAHHVTAPARDGCGLIQAVRQAMRLADVEVGAVAGISAHGTGTPFNDAMELTAFGTLFDDRLVPLHGVKGALGHSLGAAGVIEAALAVCSLEHGQLPPTVGLQTPDPLTVGPLSAKPLPLKEGLLLSTNSGFGGINAALLFGKGEPC